MDIINVKLAKKLKPLVSEAMDAISNIMENPAEFISQGHWTIPNDFMFSQECQNIYDTLPIDEHRTFYAWIRNWLISNGWGFAHKEVCEPETEIDFRGSEIFPLHSED